MITDSYDYRWVITVRASFYRTGRRASPWHICRDRGEWASGREKRGLRSPAFPPLRFLLVLFPFPAAPVAAT